MSVVLLTVDETQDKKTPTTSHHPSHQLGHRNMKLAVLLLVTSGSASAVCQSNIDCNLNGVCKDEICDCDTAWSGSPTCGTLSFASAAFRLYDGSTDVPQKSSSTSSWGGTPVFDSQTNQYYLFLSEFVNNCGLDNWSPNSRIIATSSPTLSGPFEFEYEVIPSFHHNPSITRSADNSSFLMYMIGREVDPSELPDCSNNQTSTIDPAPGNMESNITLLSAVSLRGPWTKVGVVLTGNDDINEWDADTTNPSALVGAGGEVYLMYRGCVDQCPEGSEQIGLSISKNGWNCSVDVPEGCRYEKIKGGPLFDATHESCEDPFLYRDSRGGWHALLHRVGGNGGFACDENTGVGCDVGAHAFSSNGLEWTYSKEVAYTTTVKWSDGETEILNRRERPILVFDENGVPIMMTNGAQGSKEGNTCDTNEGCRSFTMGQFLET